MTIWKTLGFFVLLQSFYNIYVILPDQLDLDSYHHSLGMCIDSLLPQSKKKSWQQICKSPLTSSCPQVKWKSIQQALKDKHRKLKLIVDLTTL